MCCLRWAARPGMQLTVDEAERLPAATAALACTNCKCAILQAEKAVVADAPAAADAAQGATAGGRAGAPARLARVPWRRGPRAWPPLLLLLLMLLALVLPS